MPAGAPPLVLLAAGGTGGHLFPAQALADALLKRGAIIDLATDARAAHFKFPARTVHLIPSATLCGRNPVSLARTATLLTLGTAKAWSMLGRVRPAVVVGFGGYPTVPPLMAATLRGIPTVLHEQNGVMGRANRLLAARVTAIATGFRTLARLDPRLQGKITFTGNPVRAEVITAAASPYAAPAADGKLRLLVFGGSQGARAINQAMIESLPGLRAKIPGIHIIHQTGQRDYDRVLAAYQQSGISGEVHKFIDDMPATFGRADLLVCRSGASTVGEITAAGKPAIFVPFPAAADDHQNVNARALERAGAAIVVEESNLEAAYLVETIVALIGDSRQLRTMSAAAKSLAHPQAVEDIAEMVAKLARVEG